MVSPATDLSARHADANVGDAGTDPFDVTFRAVSEDVGRMRRAAIAFLSAAGVGDAAASDIGLAISESVTNVVQHAYVGSEPGPVRLRVAVRPPGVEVIVQDEGSGLMPRADSPGLGLGLPILATITARVEMRERPGGGTQLGMWFSLDG